MPLAVEITKKNLLDLIKSGLLRLFRVLSLNREARIPRHVRKASERTGRPNQIEKVRADPD